MGYVWAPSANENRVPGGSVRSMLSRVCMFVYCCMLNTALRNPAVARQVSTVSVLDADKKKCME